MAGRQHRGFHFQCVYDRNHSPGLFAIIKDILPSQLPEFELTRICGISRQGKMYGDADRHWPGGFYVGATLHPKQGPESMSIDVVHPLLHSQFLSGLFFVHNYVPTATLRYDRTIVQYQEFIETFLPSLPGDFDVSFGEAEMPSYAPIIPLRDDT